MIDGSCSVQNIINMNTITCGFDYLPCSSNAHSKPSFSIQIAHMIIDQGAKFRTKPRINAQVEFVLGRSTNLENSVNREVSPLPHKMGLRP